MQLKFLVPVVAARILSTACSIDTVSSKDVKADAVHQSYSLTYSESENSTRMWAQFRVGGWSGTTVDLDEPSHLRINGGTTSKSTFLGTSYQSARGGFVPSATFEYTDSEGKTLVNSISIEPVRLLYAAPTVSVTRTYEAEVEAANLVSNDYVKAEIEQTYKDPQTGQTHYLHANGVFDRPED